MKFIALMALAGAIGTLARYGIALSMQRVSTQFPWSTLLINVLGSLLLAFAYRYLVGMVQREQLKLIFAVGFCGAFTTFSTFSLETLRLLEDGRWSRAGAYVLASVLLSVGAAYIGFQLAAMAERV